MAIALTFLYAVLLLPGIFSREGKERTVYIALSAIALIFAAIAGSILRSDHVGASLSGMVSIFMR